MNPARMHQHPMRVIDDGTYRQTVTGTGHAYPLSSQRLTGYSCPVGHERIAKNDGIPRRIERSGSNGGSSGNENKKTVSVLESPCFPVVLSNAGRHRPVITNLILTDRLRAVT